MNKLDSGLTKAFAVRVLENGGVKTSVDLRYILIRVYHLACFTALFQSNSIDWTKCGFVYYPTYRNERRDEMRLQCE